MKLKVLRYGSYPRHNEIVTGWVEAEKVNDRVYVRYYTRDDAYPPEYCEVILNVDGIFFEHGDYPKHIYERADFIPTLTGYAENFVASVNKNAEEERHISLLFIKVFELSGLDTAHLWLSRERFLEKQEAEEKAKEEQRRIRMEEEAKKENERLDEVKQKFILGERIDAGDFLDIAKKDGFEIHIRTKGTINSCVNGLDRSGTVWVRRKQGKARPKTDGCHKAIADYLVFLASAQTAAVNPQLQNHGCYSSLLSLLKVKFSTHILSNVSMK